MRWLVEMWSAVRETSFVAAQVVTLGVVAMVVGLMALNAVAHRPASPTPVGPSRPLSALVPTLVPDVAPLTTRTATPAPRDTPTPVAATSTPQPTTALRVAEVAPPPVEPTAPAPAATPPPAPSPNAQPSPTSSVPGQLMKVLPAQDGLPARVRAEPSTKSPILVRVPIGAKVEVVGTAQGDELQPGNGKWLKIRWQNVTGYVYSTLLGEG